MNVTRKLLGMLAQSFRDNSYSSPSWHDRFRKAESGQIAIIFALMIVPMVTLVGFAVDYGRAYRDRTTIQLALDSAVLAAGRTFDQTGDTTQATAAGEAFFNATIES